MREGSIASKSQGLKDLKVTGFLFCRIIAFIVLCALFFISVPNVAYTYKLPDTGQTKCYQSVSPYAEISCAGTGQDGEYSINPMSYTDNGNGTVTDNNTGFIWQKCSAGQNNDVTCSGTATTKNWADAGSYCDNLVLGGYSDWRLPTKKELMNLVDYSIPSPGPTINSTYFLNTKSGRYWSSNSFPYNSAGAFNFNFDDGYVSIYGNKSSSLYVRCVRGSSYPVQSFTDYFLTTKSGRYWSSNSFPYNSAGAFNFNFDDGYVSIYGNKSSSLYVRCVRGSSYPVQSFTDNGNGSVSDNGTGLMWQKGEAGLMPWQQAIEYCKNLTLSGYSDWRLPNIKELDSIADDLHSYPAINKTVFHDAVANDLTIYWSSTTNAASVDSAWGVGFSCCGDGYGNKSNWQSVSSYVRCVRAGQGGSFKLPDTGQTKCYQAVSPYAEISCAGTGQDEEYSINPKSYTDNGNGTVTDNNAGLMWQKCSAGQNNDATCSGTATTKSWADAGAYCTNLRTGGYSDWRLPTKKELITLADYGIPYPGPTINTTYFPNTRPSDYWSSNTLAYTTSYAWVVYFGHGDVLNYTKTYSSSSVRCVRAGQSGSLGNFTDNANGTVTDTKTGLMWQKCSAGQNNDATCSGTTTSYTWQNALNYCNILALGGYDDWRLPNAIELESIRIFFYQNH